MGQLVFRHAVASQSHNRRWRRGLEKEEGQTQLLPVFGGSCLGKFGQQPAELRPGSPPESRPGDEAGEGELVDVRWEGQAGPGGGFPGAWPR